MNNSIISVKELHKSYISGNNKLHVLKGINIEIEQGEMVSIMGSSGSGKSSLLNVLGILDNYDSGQYLLNNTLMKNLNEKKAAWYRNQMIGFVFQSFNLINFKNAMENVALPLYYQGVPRKKRNLIAMEYMERVGLKDWAHHLPSELSGGQKQRVAIARAIVDDPKIIVADEPTGNLDPQNALAVMEILQKINRTGTTIVMATHDVGIVNKYKNRVILFENGQIVNESKGGYIYE